jgi:hypothetical protein
MARPAAQQKKQREDDVMSPYQIAQERDGYMLEALEMQDELNRLRHFKVATLRLARDMPGRPG